jgi:putative ABC transport system ATP-binding protein
VWPSPVRLSNNPLVILADEATGNLDSKSGKEILDLFDELNQQGKTSIFVTHDERMVERCTRIIRLRDGVVETDEAGAKAERLRGKVIGQHYGLAA